MVGQLYLNIVIVEMHAGAVKVENKLEKICAQSFVVNLLNKNIYITHGTEGSRKKFLR